VHKVFLPLYNVKLGALGNLATIKETIV